MHVRFLARRATALAATTLLLIGLTSAISAPAHAGQVGVTISITGAGQVILVEGAPAGGGNGACDATANKLDPAATITCARFRTEAAFEAWVWLRPVPLSDAGGGWKVSSAGWRGCDETRLYQGAVECGVHSGAFSSDERAPHITFVDTVAPVVSPISASVSAATDRTATFTFRTNEPATTYCRFDDDPVGQPCTSPLTRSFATDGSHRIAVQAVDLSENQSTVSATTTTLIDTALEQTPPAATNSRTATFTYSTRGGTSFACSLDGAAGTNCGSNRRITWSFEGLAEGRHTLAVWARDGSDVDPVPARYEWDVDTVAPETTISRAVVDGDDARFEVSAPGADRLECRMTRNGTAEEWAACAQPLELSDLAPATYALEIRAVDAAGNADQTPATHAWTVSAPPNTPSTPGTPGTPSAPGTPDTPGTIDAPDTVGGAHGTAPDTVAPDTVLTAAPQAGSWLLADRTTVRYAATEAAASWRCTLDGAPRSCTGDSTQLTGLTAGTHVLRVAAVDASGNADPTPATRTWSVPRPSAALKHGRGWRQRSAPSAYSSAWAVSRRRGAVLSARVRAARTVVLVATTGPRQGAVRVYAGSRLLRTVRLTAATTRSRRVLPVAVLGTPFTGRLRIVTATGKRVRVEGLGVR